MPKERSINPAEAQRKAEKAKAIKKGMLLCLIGRMLDVASIPSWWHLAFMRQRYHEATKMFFETDHFLFTQAKPKQPPGGTRS